MSDIDASRDELIQAQEESTGIFKFKNPSDLAAAMLHFPGEV